MKAVLGALFAFIFFVGTSLAGDSSKAAKIENAWRQWAQQNGVRSSTIAVAVDGVVVHSAGIGVPANTRMPIASNSKAITAVCVGKLISAGKLSLDNTLGQVFGANLEALGLSNPKAASIKIRNLLAQSSGLTPDSTQNLMGGWIGSSNIRHEEVAQIALNRSTNKRPGRYLYNNENYAVLGAVLTRLSGKDYYKLCGDLALRPHGITSGRKSSKWGAQGAWGGWEMSASDYLRFVVGEFSPQTSVGKNPNRWAKVSIGGGASYGMGVLFRRAGRSYNFWHNGRHCYGSAGNAGSFFASWAGNVAVAVMYDICPGDRQQNDLDVRLYDAAR